MNKNILIYHHNDNDGYLSAAVAHHFLSKKPSNHIKFTAGRYDGYINLEGLEWADEIYVLDYSLPLELMERFFDKITWIDHHKSAIINIGQLEAQLDKTFKGIREIGKSGCLLTWEYFSDDKGTPRVIRYVNDRDVWSWRMGEDTAAFHEASRMFMTDLKKWEELLASRWGDKYVNDLIEDGHGYLNFIRNIVDEYNKEYAWEGTFEGHQVVFLNGSARISGELHKRLREQHPNVEFAITFMVVKEEVNVGLYRQDGLTSPDLGEIAKKYGGGGHEGAAGFFIKLKKWNKLIND